MAQSNAISTLIGVLVQLLDESPNSGDPSNPPPHLKRNVFVLCTGASGCGSSSVGPRSMRNQRPNHPLYAWQFINRLIEGSAQPTTTPMKVGKGTISCTKKVKWTHLVPRDRAFPIHLARKYHIYVGDTPGFDFNDYKTEMTARDIIQKIKKSIRRRNPSGGIAGKLGVLVLYDQGSDRVSSRPDATKFLSQAWRDKAVQHTVVVSTKWSYDLNRHDTDNGQRNDGPRRLEAGGPLSASIPSNPGFDECTDQEDAWIILSKLVEKVDAGNYVIRQRKSWRARLFGWMNSISV